MNKLEEKEIMKKGPFAKSTWYKWYDLLINHIFEPIKE